MSVAKGKVQTVLGAISPSELGITMPHEHLSLDFSVGYRPPINPFFKDNPNLPFSIENLGWIRQYPYSHKLNLSLNSHKELMIGELNDFKRHGGGAVVENTVHGLKRDVAFVKRASEATGVHVVIGTGFYIDESRSESERNYSQEQYADIMRNDLLNGWDGTDIKCGVIGEMGCSWPMTGWLLCHVNKMDESSFSYAHPSLPMLHICFGRSIPRFSESQFLENHTACERRALLAAAEVQSSLGAPLIIHPGRDPQAPIEIARILQEAGAIADKTVMSHLDRTIADYEVLDEFAQTGMYCEYDLFGLDTPIYQFNTLDMPSDAQRIGFIKFLVNAGYQDKVLMAHDLHTLHRLKQFGGHGLTHILLNIIPHMLARGISQEAIDKILQDNPQKWLTFV